jgi:alkylation response protein AidB-like acyl-CoA dehydrogenase
LEIGPLLFPHAMVDSDTRRVTFQDLLLAEEDLLISGKTEQMSQLIGFELIWHQLLIATLYLGAAARAIEEVRLFLRSVRTAGDRPLAELDGMVVDTGRLVLRYRTAWSMVERTAEAVAEVARSPLNPEALDSVMDSACVAKHTGTISAEEIVTSARRIIGARSFTGGHPLERLSQETPFGPLGPELNAGIERRLGRRALGETSFLAHLCGKDTAK